jgi:predicted nucleic acid-binding protein
VSPQFQLRPAPASLWQLYAIWARRSVICRTLLRKYAAGATSPVDRAGKRTDDFADETETPDLHGARNAARRLGIHTVATRSLWHGALLRAVQSGVAVYDTLFVELADRERVPLATFDQRLLKSWPAIARRPADLIAR